MAKPNYELAAERAAKRAPSTIPALPLARFACATLVATLGVPARVLHAIRMTVRTVGFGRVPFPRDLRGESAAFVFCLGDGLKMGGIHAQAVAAQVVDLQPIGDGPSRSLKRETVGQYGASSRPERAVSRGGSRCRPRPAAVAFVYELRNEPVRKLNSTHADMVAQCL